MRAILATMLLLTALLAGCSGDKEKEDADESGTTSSSQTSSGPSSAATPKPVLYLNITAANGTHRFTTGSAAGQGASGNASSTSATGTTTAASGNGTGGNATGNGTGVPGGSAPLDVTFELGAAKLPAGQAARWSFDFGRTGGNGTGNATAPENGTTLPATLEHTYEALGDYNVTFILRVGDLTPQALQATIRIGNGTGNVSVGRPLPDQLHFEFGEALGCAGDAHSIEPTVPLHCVSFQGGPDATGLDGHWLALTPDYWGLMLTTTMEEPTGQNHDSDCYFLAEDATTETGTGSNGGEGCLGIVPEGTAWLFLYPWGTPATAMTADFALASAE